MASPMHGKKRQLPQQLAYCWEMNNFPIRKCNRTEVS